MSTKSWAEEEVKIAIEREKKNSKEPDDWKYGAMCYDSALKAYKCMLHDCHSGYSWNITANILKRLLSNKPLTPIEDIPEVWNESYTNFNSYKSCQCKRYPSLFKEIYSDGTVRYRDTERAYGVNIDNPTLSYGGGGIDKYVDEIVPITMPYYPTVSSIKVITDDFLADPKNGDFDHKAYLYMIIPEGTKLDGRACLNPKKIVIDKYFKDINHNLVECSKGEYYTDREKRIIKRRKND